MEDLYTDNKQRFLTQYFTKKVHISLDLMVPLFLKEINNTAIREIFDIILKIFFFKRKSINLDKNKFITIRFGLYCQRL